jgi:LL-diaminopimelate aminotransferase
MVLVNENYLKLPGSYLFSEIAKRVSAHVDANPKAKIIRMGIGDVTRPLPDAVIKGLHSAADEMGKTETFRGYGPEQGYQFLVEKIIKNDLNPRGLDIQIDEIFLSDGSKSDSGNIGDILSVSNKVAVTDPVYPVYVDTNAMAGRAGEYQDSGHWSNIVYIPCVSENNFVPELPTEKPDVIYLCYPNNPTGTTLKKEQLKVWVDYAIENKCLILFDAAYEAFIQEEDVPHSIFEVEGAKKVAIEFRSFSKKAGFTGTRCAYTIIPKELEAFTESGEKVQLNKLWNRRHSTKFNGVPYVIQKAAEAVYSDEGKKQVNELVNYYMTNAKIIRDSLSEMGFEIFGGVNAPYIWLKTPNNMTSWDFFDLLLTVNIVGTPGVGFGPSGEGYFRLTAFGKKEDTIEAMGRLKELFKK